MRVFITADGTEAELSSPMNMAGVASLIGADTLCTVTLVDGKHVMFVDDLGHQKGLPANAKATAHYHARCRPGANPPPIVGAVVIVPDSDFGDRGMS